MKEMIKKIREEKGGFTLAELLIVVAIVFVLVAIAVPVFTGAMDKANDAVAKANIHAVKSQASAQYLLQGEKGDVFYTATVKTDGTVGPLTKAGDVESTPDDIKENIGKQDVSIVVKITAADVSDVAAGAAGVQ